MIGIRNHQNDQLSLRVLTSVSWLLFVGNAVAEDLRWDLGLETGAVWQSRNDVQIPNDTGTRYSLADTVGSGPFPYYRLELTYQLNARHSLRFLYAPFEYTKSGRLDNDEVYNFAWFHYASLSAGYRF